MVKKEGRELSKGKKREQKYFKASVDLKKKYTHTIREEINGGRESDDFKESVMRDSGKAAT